MLYIGLILFSLFLAYISWRYVEAPFRNRKKKSQTFIFVFSIVGISFFASLGLLLSSFDGFPNRSPLYVELKKQLDWPDAYNRTEECSEVYGGDQYCLISDVKRDPTHLLLGDSHANHFYFGLNKALSKSRDNNLLMTGVGGCPPLIGVDMGYTYVHGSDLKCHERTNRLFSNLIHKWEIEHVYLAFDEAGLFDSKIHPVDLNKEFDFGVDRYLAIKGVITRTLTFYQKLGVRVTLIEDMPDSTFDKQFQKCIWNLNRVSDCEDTLRTVDNNNSYPKLLDELTLEGFHVLRTNEALKTIPMIGDNLSEIIYRDSSHLSEHGSEAIVTWALNKGAINHVENTVFETEI